MTQLQTQQTSQLMQAPERQSAASMLMNPATMQEVYKFAELMAGGVATVPKHLQKNVADCMAITMQAMQWGMFPFAVAQKTHLINGVLGYEAQLVASVVNNSGLVSDRFNFEWYGPWENVIGKFDIRKGDKGEYRVPGWKLADEQGLGVRVWATLFGEDKPRVLDLLLAQARTRNSTLWADDPKQQLAYLAQKRWARLYAPDAILGVYTQDELQEMPEREINPAPQATNGAPVAKTSLKARKAKQEPIEQEAVEAQQPANEPEIEAPNFGDEPQYSPEVEAMINALYDCYEPEHFAEWEAAAAAMGLAKNSTEYVAMSGAYLSRKREIKAKGQ